MRRDANSLALRIERNPASEMSLAVSRKPQTNSNDTAQRSCSVHPSDGCASLYLSQTLDSPTVRCWGSSYFKVPKSPSYRPNQRRSSCSNMHSPSACLMSQFLSIAKVAKELLVYRHLLFRAEPPFSSYQRRIAQIRVLLYSVPV